MTAGPAVAVSDLVAQHDLAGPALPANLRVAAQIDDALRHTGMRASELHGMRWRPTAGRFIAASLPTVAHDQPAPVGAIDSTGGRMFPCIAIPWGLACFLIAVCWGRGKTPD